MNEFGSIDAQDEVSRLAQVRCDEQIAEMQERKADEQIVRDRRKTIAKLNALDRQPWNS
jgi:hypothetical protein